ncbi:Hypothetical_protein [Hexamita inflata]|uniref:Hypothetical_protein n=1 Tax=Hexamita inflata TaxID=28002 RepID=A0AA86P220_9EUKA|nr:Hypothetical protein HINF_LOCUS17360 [Hexamita inflata]
MFLVNYLIYYITSLRRVVFSLIRQVNSLTRELFDVQLPCERVTKLMCFNPVIRQQTLQIAIFLDIFHLQGVQNGNPLESEVMKYHDIQRTDYLQLIDGIFSFMFHVLGMTQFASLKGFLTYMKLILSTD